MKIDLLDHGYIEFIESWGSDERFIEAARMSTGKGFEGWDKDERLLVYLYNNKHSTPFEMGGMVIEVKAPIFVFREWHRHRTQCLAGNTLVNFERPCDGRPYPMRLSEIVRKWASPAVKARLSKMGIRGANEKVSLIDAWHSGEKRVFKIKTERGEVIASSDHVFKTPSSHARVCDSGQFAEVMTLTSVGETRSHDPISYSGTEAWVEVFDGLDVSDWGRVRSWYGQGAHKKRSTPIIKKSTMNKSGRCVISFKGKVHQVSHLVAKAFDIAGPDEWVLHKNDNPLDNRACNLKAGSPYDNMRDQYANGGRRRLREVPAKVLSVVDAGTTETFDIEVTGNHWFSVNDGVLVHNSYNEASGRYMPLPDENYIPSIERLMIGANTATTNKQAQGNGRELSQLDAEGWSAELEELYAHAQRVYKKGIDRGVPKELARLPVPVARYSKMRASANLRNWLAFLTLRKAQNAQWEIRQYADAVGELVAEHFPRTWALFELEKSYD